MLEKIKNYKVYMEQLNDIRAIGLLIFLFVLLLMTWSGAKVIQTNYDLQKQISQLQQQNQVQQLQNNNLKLQNTYYNTNQYLELTARENFGLAAQGEKELIIPQSVAMAYVVKQSEVSKSVASPHSKQPFYQRNFESWINFFLHRQTSTD